MYVCMYVIYMAVGCAKFKKKCWQYILRCYSVKGITLLKMHSMEFVFSLNLNFLFLLWMIRTKKKDTKEINTRLNTCLTWEETFPHSVLQIHEKGKSKNRLFRLTCSETYEGGLLFKITAKKITFFKLKLNFWHQLFQRFITPSNG